MARMGTDEWIEGLDRAARASDELREASRGRRVVIGQAVVDGDRTHRWHVVLDDGEVAIRPGPADDADVTFTQDAAVAAAVARGERSARSAFILGEIRVGGDVSLLMDLGPALADLGDVFAPARDEGVEG
ncbi:MAG: SCP2 sterol-binding domain-containing protein [Acidimicrobiales bacterium]|nr:SCP2 sterol-binding domain-containing protein [Acidimicrobiales bacterium]